MTAAAPQRITSVAHAGDEDEAVEYSAIYDTSDAPAEPQAPDATVVYQLSDYEESVDDADADADADDADDVVEADDNGEVDDEAAVDDDDR